MAFTQLHRNAVQDKTILLNNSVLRKGNSSLLSSECRLTVGSNSGRRVLSLSTNLNYTFKPFSPGADGRGISWRSTNIPSRSDRKSCTRVKVLRNTPNPVDEKEAGGSCCGIRVAEQKLNPDRSSLQDKGIDSDAGGGVARSTSRSRSLDGREDSSSLTKFLVEFGKYMFVMVASSSCIASFLQSSDAAAGAAGVSASHQDLVLWLSWMAGTMVGSMISTGQVLERLARMSGRNVVITGGSRGLGKSLAREFLRTGDNVVIASRSTSALQAAVEELVKQQQEGEQSPTGPKQEHLLPLGIIIDPTSRDGKPRRRLVGAKSQRNNNNEGQLLDQKFGRVRKVVGVVCNVQAGDDVRRLVEVAVRELGSVDIWINNAALNAGSKVFSDCTEDELKQVVGTNLVGALICTREAIKLMSKQSRGGHVFNMDGAGYSGSATPRYAAYGATKCALRQMHATLLKECKKGRVGVHTASPGMVLTDLLLSGASLQNKQVFNIVCEHPETVARALVPRLRKIRGTGKEVNYLTPPRIILALVTAWLRRGRWFDDEGRAVYAAETDRLRMWAEGRRSDPVSAAMEMLPGSAWVSLLSSSIICAYVIISSAFTSS